MSLRSPGQISILPWRFTLISMLNTKGNEIHALSITSINFLQDSADTGCFSAHGSLCHQTTGCR
jgi:hypothetical protein